MSQKEPQGTASKIEKKINNVKNYSNTRKKKLSMDIMAL